MTFRPILARCHAEVCQLYAAEEDAVFRKTIAFAVARRVLVTPPAALLQTEVAQPGPSPIALGHPSVSPSLLLGAAVHAKAMYFEAAAVPPIGVHETLAHRALGRQHFVAFCEAFDGKLAFGAIAQPLPQVGQRPQSRFIYDEVRWPVEGAVDAKHAGAEMVLRSAWPTTDSVLLGNAKPLPDAGYALAHQWLRLRRWLGPSAESEELVSRV